jgi:hypothetical protein
MFGTVGPIADSAYGTDLSGQVMPGRGLNREPTPRRSSHFNLRDSLFQCEGATERERPPQHLMGFDEPEN